VIRAVTAGRRPPLEPFYSPDGASYAIFWQIAERAWSIDPEVRPSMSQILQLLGNTTISNANVQDLPTTPLTFVPPAKPPETVSEPSDTLVFSEEEIEPYIPSSKPANAGPSRFLAVDRSLRAARPLVYPFRTIRRKLVIVGNPVGKVRTRSSSHLIWIVSVMNLCAYRLCPGILELSSHSCFQGGCAFGQYLSPL
jgi:hypothetical protein